MPTPDWFHPIDFTDVCALRRVSITARWVFVEVFGGELGEKTGLVNCRPSLIAAEAGLRVADVEAAMDELVAAGVAVWCRETRTAYHVGCLIRHGASNDKHADGWLKLLLKMPECEPRAAAIQELQGSPYRADTLSGPYRDPTDTLRAREQEQEPLQEQTLTSEGDARAREDDLRQQHLARHHAKPTLLEASPGLHRVMPTPTDDEVAEYLASQGWPREHIGEAKAWAASRRANGWKNRNGRRVEDWRADADSKWLYWQRDNAGKAGTLRSAFTVATAAQMEESHREISRQLGHDPDCPGCRRCEGSDWKGGEA